MLKRFLVNLSPGDSLSHVSGGTQRKRLNDLLLTLKFRSPFGGTVFDVEGQPMRLEQQTILLLFV